MKRDMTPEIIQGEHKGRENLMLRKASIVNSTDRSHAGFVLHLNELQRKSETTKKS